MTPQERFAEKAHDEQLKRGVRVTTKEEFYPVWRVLDIILRVLTLGKNKRFLTHFTTTVGNTIYFPVGWDIEKASNADYVTLRHELVHVRQFEELANGVTILGVVLFAILYLLLPLPLGLAWFRYKFERDAYLESMLTIKSLNMDPNIEFYVEALCGADYFWAWPFKNTVRGWFYKKLELSS